MADRDVEIRISSVLAMTTGGRRVFSCPGGTVREALENMFAEAPGLRVHLLDESGEVRQHVLIYAGEDQIRWLGGLDTAVTAGTTVTVLQAVSGG